MPGTGTSAPATCSLSDQPWPFAIAASVFAANFVDVSQKITALCPFSEAYCAMYVYKTVVESVAFAVTEKRGCCGRLVVSRGGSCA